MLLRQRRPGHGARRTGSVAACQGTRADLCCDGQQFGSRWPRSFC